MKSCTPDLENKPVEENFCLYERWKRDVYCIGAVLSSFQPNMKNTWTSALITLYMITMWDILLDGKVAQW